MNPRRDPIKVVVVAGAPARFAYQATFGDYDLDDPVGIGATEEEAIEDLYWAAGDDNAAK